MLKHRSSVILVLVVAALAVAPHAARRLDDLGASLAGRAESAVWNAFLSLHARHTRLPEVRRTEAPGHETGSGATVAANRETKARERVAQPARKGTETGNGVARDRRAHEVEATFEFRAHADAIAAKLPQAFAFNSFAPLELNLQQLEGEKKAARLKAWKAEEVALAPAARYLVNGAPLGPEEARRLSRIVERHVRVKDAREAMRRGAGEVGPRRPAAEEGKPAERGPKLKEQARVACPLSAPEAPVAAAPSSHADLGAQGFDIDY